MFFRELGGDDVSRLDEILKFSSIHPFYPIQTLIFLKVNIVFNSNSVDITSFYQHITSSAPPFPKTNDNYKLCSWSATTIRSIQQTEPPKVLQWNIISEKSIVFRWFQFVAAMRFPIYGDQCISFLAQ